MKHPEFILTFSRMPGRRSQLNGYEIGTVSWVSEPILAERFRQTTDEIIQAPTDHLIN